MRVLVACEFSGAVREAFRRRGHDAYSCDLLPAEDGSSHHFQGGLWCVIRTGRWDLIIAHPPCTHLAVSGAGHFRQKIADGRQQEAIEFFLRFTTLPVRRLAIEQPVSIMSRLYRKPDQIIQPWMFGHGETKATCLWLKGLRRLQPTNVVAGREQRIFRMPPSPDRARERSRTYAGVADAMAAQWGRRRFDEPEQQTFF